jgi:hypothetical protein
MALDRCSRNKSFIFPTICIMVRNTKKYMPTPKGSEACRCLESVVSESRYSGIGMHVRRSVHADMFVESLMPMMDVDRTSSSRNHHHLSPLPVLVRRFDLTSSPQLKEPAGCLPPQSCLGRPSSKNQVWLVVPSLLLPTCYVVPQAPNTSAAIF